MQLTVNRFEFGTNYTIGKLFIDGVYECYTLEREVTQRDRKPAIPEGSYKVIIDHSNRFGKDMPHVLDVPGYEGIRIHSGNTDADTEGCILVGITWAGTDFIGRSRDAFDSLFSKMKSAPSIQLEINHAP